MKVLSLIEPFATLIKEKKKLIETRSWKTNYRGELYIHASKTKIAKKDIENKELMALLPNKTFSYGHIICKCNLVDCIYMTKEYVEDMKTNHPQEYLCGEYQEGRYAWILEDIEPLKNLIPAKGQLNIWNFYSELEVMNLMKNIAYGWVDQNSQKHSVIDEFYSDNFRLQSPKDVINNQIGVCWDQVELERYYFKGNDWHIRTYFLVHYDNDRCPTHTFLTFLKNHKYYWFEHAWERFWGVHEYDSEKKLLLDIRDKFIQYELNHNYVKSNIYLYEYRRPKYHITTQEFYKHCENGTYIDLDARE